MRKNICHYCRHGKVNKVSKITRIECPTKGFSHNFDHFMKHKLRTTILIIIFLGFVVCQIFHYMIIDAHRGAIELAAALTTLVHITDDIIGEG